MSCPSIHSVVDDLEGWFVVVGAEGVGVQHHAETSWRGGDWEVEVRDVVSDLAAWAEVVKLVV